MTPKLKITPKTKIISKMKKKSEVDPKYEDGPKSEDDRKNEYDLYICKKKVGDILCIPPYLISVADTISVDDKAGLAGISEGVRLSDSG